ncbi:hypothetical protein [Lewinella cohaerens]|uniref:hypothetical protein n=1 Tax=Lewinella cohaerens TaxID=70995 RepID=UPI001B7FC1F4|nr:hypothetical protein [Lewinella cohaerens]
MHHVLMPLLYFEIFSYPLTFDEILHFCQDQNCQPEALKKSIQEGIEKGYIFQHEQFYLCQNKPAWVKKRKEHNHRATRYLSRAYKMAQIIRRFPYVRAVFLSGALSKNVMPKDGDIDYFIVTQTGRLWISRTLLVLFKKIFLLNSHKYFCVNYFVDEEHLEIEEKNLFTAMETVTLVPLHNPEIYRQFYAVNDWAQQYFPNSPMRPLEKTIPVKKSFLQNSMESLLNGKMGDRIDLYCMRTTLGHWKKKFSNFDSDKFDNALKSRSYVSKHHPQDFQNKVLTAYEERIQTFEHHHQIQLDRPMSLLKKETKNHE